MIIPHSIAVMYTLVYSSYRSLFCYLKFSFYHIYRYFLHYQWLPFYVCSLAILYFFPYLIFKAGNTDMITLVDTVGHASLRDVGKITNNYFNYKINSKLKMKSIVYFNLFVKVRRCIILVYNFHV